MPSITERSGVFKVRVSCKEKKLHATFHDRETAELWGYYKESLFNEINAFDVPSNELISLDDAIELKIRACIENKLDNRTIMDIRELKKLFIEFKNKPIKEVTFEDLVHFCDKFMNTPTFRGGLRSRNTGTPIMPTAQTLLSKLRRLSSVYSNIIENGIPVENIPQKVGAYLNDRIKKTA